MTLVLLLTTLIAQAGAEPNYFFCPAHEVAEAYRERDRFAAETKLVRGALAERVRRIGRELAAVSDRPDLPFEFFVIDDSAKPLSQAGSRVGGAVSLNKSLVGLLGRSDDELAFALAHEIAHVTLGHHQATGLAGEVEASGSDACRRRRELEIQADRYGALYVVRAGYRVSAAQTALHRLAEARRGSATRDCYPNYSKRIRLLQQFEGILQRSVDAFDSGLLALEAGDTQEAIGTLNLFVAQFPHSLAGRVNLGTACLVRLNEQEGSPSDLEEPLPLMRESGRRVRGVFDGELLERAHRNFSQALALSPTEPRARIGLALVELRRGAPEVAEQLVLGLGSVEAQVIRGNARYLQQEFAEARGFYRQALDRRPQWVTARKNLAMVSERLGAYQEARRIWGDLVTHDRVRREAALRLEFLGPGGPGRESP